jgi:hypothetical protein
MSRAVGIEQLGQLARCALLAGDRVVPGVGRIPEMCGIEKVVVTVDLGFVIDRHRISFQQAIRPSKLLAGSSGEWEWLVERLGVAQVARFWARKNRTISADASGPTGSV